MAYPLIYRERTPHIRLTEHAKCYWEFYQHFDAGQEQVVDPDSSYELILMQEGQLYFDGKPLPQCFIVGQLHTPAVFTGTGDVRFIGIRFYPWGLAAYANMAGLRAAGIVTAATEVCDETLLLRLNDIVRKKANNMFSKLDAVLLEALSIVNFHAGNTVLAAVKELQPGSNFAHIADIAKAYKLSPRQLRRKLKESTGMSPQEIAIRLRFEKARDMLMHQPEMPFSDVVLACGYTDQSHLIHEFQKYMRRTPGAHAAIYQQLQERMANAENVSFIQYGHSND